MPPVPAGLPSVDALDLLRSSSETEYHDYDIEFYRGDFVDDAVRSESGLPIPAVYDTGTLAGFDPDAEMGEPGFDLPTQTGYVTGEEPYEPLRVDPQIEANQRERLAVLRDERDNQTVNRRSVTCAAPPRTRAMFCFPCGRRSGCGPLAARSLTPCVTSGRVPASGSPRAGGRLHAAHFPEARGGGGADALATVIIFQRTVIACQLLGGDR